MIPLTPSAHRLILRYQNTFIVSAPLPPEGGMHLHPPPPDVHQLLTLHLRITLQYAQNSYEQSPLTISLLTKIVDPSLESSLNILIFISTRIFGMPCCPPPFAKAGDINYTRHCAIRLFKSGRTIRNVCFVYL